MVLHIQDESTPLVGSIPPPVNRGRQRQAQGQQQHAAYISLSQEIDTDDTPSDRQPLLQGDQQQGCNHASTETPAPAGFTRNALLTVVTVSAILFILEVGNYMSMAPQRAIFEQIVCEGYYFAANGETPAADRNLLSGGDAIDERCKIEPVQSEVAFVNGWLDTFQMIPGRSFLSLFFCPGWGWFC
jgi:hypothetical protein